MRHTDIRKETKACTIHKDAVTIADETRYASQWSTKQQRERQGTKKK